SRMHADETAALGVPEFERRILHAERLEQVLLEEGAERLPADPLHGLADPIDVDAVVPAIARIESERRGERLVLAGNDARRTGLLLVAQEVGIPDVIAEAGRVSQEVPQGDGPLGRAELRLAGGLEAVEHSRRGPFGQKLAQLAV